MRYRQCRPCFESLATAEFGQGTYADYDRSSWLSSHADKKLGDMVLPGSHHSGMSSTGVVGGLDIERAWMVCQSIDITEQLLYGIRFLDLRIHRSGLRVSHGPVEGMTLNFILGEVGVAFILM